MSPSVWRSGRFLVLGNEAKGTLVPLSNVQIGLLMQNLHWGRPMELAWLEDFLELVVTRNFSTAATARSISQPAFSRRIKSLEAWVGADLIDRSTYPVHLTEAGKMFLPRCQEQVHELYRLRTDCRNAAGANAQLVTFAALHTLSIYFFPIWIRLPAMQNLGMRSSMHADDFMGCIEHLTSNRSDFVITYDHPDGPPVLKTGPFESLQVGTDRLILVSGTDVKGLSGKAHLADPVALASAVEPQYGLPVVACGEPETHGRGRPRSGLAAPKLCPQMHHRRRTHPDRRPADVARDGNPDLQASRLLEPHGRVALETARYKRGEANGQSSFGSPLIDARATAPAHCEMIVDREYAKRDGSMQ
jgi:DNA-binding transcriptional LysR family regulator